MKKKIRHFVTHPLISGSFLIFLGSMTANVLSFAFNLFMSRNLAISEYGTLVSLLSIITLFSIPAAALTPTIITVAGKYFATKEYSSLHDFHNKMLRFLLTSGFVFILLPVIFSRQIGSFLHIENSLLLLFTGIGVLLAYLGTLYNSFLQAKLAFGFLSFSTALSAIVKLTLGIVVIFLGFGINGAIVTYLVSFSLSVIIGIIVLRKFLFSSTSKDTKIMYKQLVSYGIPSAIVVFSLNSFVSTDVILVKHLFSEQQAGLYAGLSLIGRVIFYATAPIGTVMFPVLVNRFNTKKRLNHILFYSVALVGLASLTVTIFYFLFPHFVIILFLKNNAYLNMGPYLGKFGLFITIYSMLSLLTYYFLSIKRTKIAYALFLGAVLQAILIFIFHENIGAIVDVSILTSGILLVVLLSYFKFRVK